MERNPLNSQGYKLESQIREAFGRVTYTQTCHEKLKKKLLKINDDLKTWQIVFLAMLTGSFAAAFISIEKLSAIIAALSSFGLLILNTYAKNSGLVEKAQKHQQASDLLRRIRKEYVSLLTDFETLAPEQIMEKRDELQERTAKIYLNLPGINYTQAKKVLKTEEVKSFSEEEIDIMLPDAIRRCTRTKDSV